MFSSISLLNSHVQKQLAIHMLYQSLKARFYRGWVSLFPRIIAKDMIRGWQGQTLGSGQRDKSKETKTKLNFLRQITNWTTTPPLPPACFMFYILFSSWNVVQAMIKETRNGLLLKGRESANEKVFFFFCKKRRQTVFCQLTNVRNAGLSSSLQNVAITALSACVFLEQT